jgi:DNA-binding beta-propeller fold protein YncE
MRTCTLFTVAAFALTAGGYAVADSSPAQTWQVNARWAIGGTGGWDYLSLDAATHRLFVTRSDHVAVVDIDHGKMLGEVRPTEGVHGVALAPGLNRGYASNGRGDSVTVFDLKSLATLKTIPIEGHNPDAILFDEPTQRVFTFNGHSKDATVIDAKTDRPIATIALTGKPEFAVSDGAGRLYLNIEDRAELTTIDARTAKVVATWPLPGCEEPSGLALDRARQRLFSVCQNGRLVVTDAKSGHHVADVPIGKGPDAVAFDAQRHLVFSSNGEDGTLTVIHQNDADHYTVVANVPTQKSARTLAIDPPSQRVFLAAAEFEPAPAPVEGKPKTRPAMKADSFVILVVGPHAVAATHAK